MSPSIRRWTVRTALALVLASAWPAVAAAAGPSASATPHPDSHVAVKPDMKRQVLHVLPLTIEGESLVGFAQASAGAVSAQDMSGFGSHCLVQAVRHSSGMRPIPSTHPSATGPT